MKIRYGYLAGQAKKALAYHQETMAIAATEAIRRAGAQAQTDSRASIAQAGFSQKWVNALRMDTYPKRGVSLGAVAVIYHRIAYAGIFEEGGSIRGKPFLWLPLPTIPQKIGDKRMTPKLFRATYGPLWALNMPGKRPLLIARIKDLPGSSGPRDRKTVPAFVGIDAVEIKKKFGVTEAVERAAARVGEFYAQHLP